VNCCRNCIQNILIACIICNCFVLSTNNGSSDENFDTDSVKRIVRAKILQLILTFIMDEVGVLYDENNNKGSFDRSLKK